MSLKLEKFIDYLLNNLNINDELSIEQNPVMIEFVALI